MSQVFIGKSFFGPDLSPRGQVVSTHGCDARGRGFGAGVCLALPPLANLDAALCVCVGPFQPGSGGNGCEGQSTIAPTTASAPIESTSGRLFCLEK